MANSEFRSVRENYWYTSAQIDDVGRAWEQENPERLFLYSVNEPINKTALNEGNLPLLDDLPKKILLPLNRGNNHWTAIAITLQDSAEDDKVNVNISFTDSLNTSTSLSAHPLTVRSEIERIATVIRNIYGTDNINLTSSVYPHTWSQPDGSSCGPYSLANAMRSLEGRGAEPNPGRKRIREQQLDMMTQGTAISGCSTNNTIDEILLDWIINQYENQLPVRVTQPEDVENICRYFAIKHGREYEDIVQIMHDEYCSGTIKPWFRPLFVNDRVKELINEYNIQPISKPAEKKRPKNPLAAKETEIDLVGEEQDDQDIDKQFREAAHAVQNSTPKPSEKFVPQFVNFIRALWEGFINLLTYVGEKLSGLVAS